MFEAHDLDTPGPFGERHLVRDRVRGVELLTLTRFRSGDEVFLLRRGTDLIPVRTQMHETLEGGWHQFRRHILDIGGPTAVDGALLEHSFASDEDRLATLHLAVEAILVHGTAGDGLKFADGLFVVSLQVGDELRAFSLTDFGYTPRTLGADAVRPRA